MRPHLCFQVSVVIRTRTSINTLYLLPAPIPLSPLLPQSEERPALSVTAANSVDTGSATAIGNKNKDTHNSNV